MSRRDIRTRLFYGSIRSETRREHRSELVCSRQLPSYRMNSTVVKKSTERRLQTYRTKPPT